MTTTRQLGTIAAAETVMRNGRLPGLYLDAFRRGELVAHFVAGAARLAPEEPLREDHLFGCGSVSKVYVGLAVARLVHTGSLDWSTPLTRLIPELDFGDSSCNAQASIAHALSHRLGLSRIGVHEIAWLSIEDRLAHLPRVRRAGPLGCTVTYSNFGYLLAALVVERLTGRPYAEALRSLVLDPLGDRGTVVGPAAAHRAGSMVRPYGIDGDEVVELPCIAREEETPSSGVFAPLGAFAEIARLMSCRGRHAGFPFLSPGVFEAWTAPTETSYPPGDPLVAQFWPEAEAVRPGLCGFWERRRGREVLIHPGVLFGYQSALFYDPRAEVAGVLACNATLRSAKTAAHPALTALRYGLIDELCAGGAQGDAAVRAETTRTVLARAHLLAAIPPAPPREPAEPLADPDQVRALCGRYDGGRYGALAITGAPGQVQVRFGQPHVPERRLQALRAVHDRWRLGYLDPAVERFAKWDEILQGIERAPDGSWRTLGIMGRVYQRRDATEEMP